MEKIIEPNSWNFNAPVASLIKFSDKGLVGSDLGVLVKRAGDEFAHKIKNIKIAKDQTPGHATEASSQLGAIRPC